MKKETLLSFIFIVFSLCLHAQITITEADMPQIDDVQTTIEAFVDPGITIGNSGANQTWDFSDLVGTDTTVTIFIDPAGTPGENIFPTATLAVEFSGSYSYAEINSNAALFLGVSADTSGMGDYYHLIYDPTEKFFELPTTYGTSYMDESGYSNTIEVDSLGFDSIRTINIDVKNVDFDGYGTVITPLGSFDGLREMVITSSFDTIQGYFGGMWQTLYTEMSIDTSYNWHSKESKGSLVNIDIFNGEVSYVSFQDLEPTFNPPNAAFSYIDQGQGLVFFMDQSTNLPTSWMWDFGDSNTSNMQSPSHTYAAGGMYNVCLTVSNSAGSDNICQMLDIGVAMVPVASFSYTDQGQGAVDFVDQSSNLPTSWMWDFGDSNTSTMQNPSHTFASTGMYNVCLTVTNSAGSDTNCQMLDISVSIVPVASFSYTDQGQGAVDFMDQSSNLPTSWMWDFGDSNTSTMQNPSHTFASTGMYNVCLTVTNSAGSDTNCQMLDVTVTSIKVLIDDLNVEVFPNPSSDWLGLNLRSGERQHLDFILFDELGHAIMIQTVESEGQYVFDIKDLSAGIYYFILRSEDRQVVANGNLLKSNGN